MSETSSITYKEKLEALKHVQWGERYRSKDFFLNQLALSKSHPNYETEFLGMYPKMKIYIDDLLIMFRKQLPEMDREIKRIQSVRKIKEIKESGQYSLVE